MYSYNICKHLIDLIVSLNVRCLDAVDDVGRLKITL
jgi:hypothetical protein